MKGAELIVVRLERFESSDAGTFGTVYANGLELVSAELPWRQNQPDVSCIPEGTYEARWCFSPRLQQYSYLLRDVPAREGIRIHAANFAGDRSMRFRSQLNGCIALGRQIKFVDRQQSLIDSSSAVREFDSRLKAEPFMMEITAKPSLRFLWPLA